jgi:3-hydroxyisobutyrate dehydrogenase-like beta-hydroxyacid dehydrogenase
VGATGEIGFVGTGNMGGPIARRLLAAGHAVIACDARTEALRGVLAAGASPAGSPREVASRCGVVFTSLPGPREIEAVVTGEQGILAGASRGAIHVDLSTTSLASVKRLHALEAAAGVSLVDAPVSGGAVAAEQGTLSVMASGDRDAFLRVEPLLGAFAKSVFHLGGSGAGTLAKLVNNAIFLCAGLLAQEGFTVWTRAGFAPARLLEVLKASSGGMYAGLAELTLRRDFDNAFFTLALAEKDVALALDAARSLDVPARVTEAAHGVYARALAQGLGSQVFFATLRAIEAEAGIEIPRLEQWLEQ